MDNDDEPIGRVLTRREIIALFGAAGAALVGAGRAFTSGGNQQTYLSLIQSAPGSETPTATPTATGTSIPTGTATTTGTALPTSTATETATATATETVPTATATATGTAVPTGTATATGTATPMITVTPTATPTITATPGTTPTCIVRPEQTEGPYFVDERLNRSDIRVDPFDDSIREGVLLYLRFNVTQITANACTFLQGVYVDVWHCDAMGDYSDIQSEGTLGRKFLRGYQVTNAFGAVEFLTIYPGWYPGRTVHIHFKIRTELNNTGYDFTSQLYFDDTLTDQVFLQPPYNTRGTRDTRNNNDGIYQNGGTQLTLTCTPDGSGGYAATFNIGLAIH
jgi:protocatechuate 3,4-dioxygenase beta subunit